MANGSSRRSEAKFRFEPEPRQVHFVPHSPLGHILVRHHALPLRRRLQGHVHTLMDGILLSGKCS